MRRRMQKVRTVGEEKYSEGDRGQRCDTVESEGRQMKQF
jgi:hypothetical protein